MRRFSRFACIDWSGAKGERQKGIALAVCENGIDAPRLVAPPERGWSRAEVLDWLLAQAETGTSILVGLDLSPALPFADRDAYFPGWAHSPTDAKALWAFVDALCADDLHHAVGGLVGHPEASRHFRIQRRPVELYEPGRGRLRDCERRQLERKGLSPSSCFNLVGAAQVGKSSLTGMRVLHALAGRVPVWPFDQVPEDGPLIVEIYTTIAALDAGRPPGHAKMRDAASLDAALTALGSRRHTPLLGRYDDHRTDAILTAAWLRNAAGREELWHPPDLTADLRRTEGWTFGVP